MPLRPRRLCLLAQVLGVGQERHGHGARQFPGAPGARPVEPDIVDHDRDQRTTVEVTKRQCVAPPCLLGRCGCRDLLWFGRRLPRLLIERCPRLARFGLGVFGKVRQIFEARIFGLRLARRRRTSALHVFERIARQPIAIRQIEALSQPIATEQTADEHQHERPQ